MTTRSVAEDPAAVSAALEAALLRELRRLYAQENAERFGHRLVPPVLTLSDVATRLGRWVSAARSIELSRTLVMERSWLDVMSVLAHEMAHQFVDEVLGVRDETAHGETFRRVCFERGIDSRAAGAPLAPANTPEIDRALDRIRKLLALAGSPNQHEAEVAMRKAHELMLRHNIAAASADVEAEYETRHLGDPEKRGNRVEADIAGLLSQYFFVKVIRVPVYVQKLARRGLVYEIMGTHSNVEMASHVYAFLLATSERLWQENRLDARVRSGRDRQSYQSGVVRGFREKLDAERSELRGTGLVWLGDRKLDGFYRARFPRVTHRQRSARIDLAHTAGREAGRTIVLHKPVEASASRATQRLLRG